MMTSILENEEITFKVLEQKIYQYACEIARSMTRIILEDCDDGLARERDKGKYRNKGKRSTSIKTIYGEVSYARRVYETRLEDGTKSYVYLLDEAIAMDSIGLISTNLAEQIALSVTEASYRKGASIVSSASGAAISHGGAWNLIQVLGSRVSEEEDALVRKMDNGNPGGEKAVPVLFEEMDGVWLHMQGRDHKREQKKEMKVCTVHEGWSQEKEKEGRSTLAGKKVIAGMEDGKHFHEKREAYIEDIYNPDEIGRRILNGDGGKWIREPYDPDAIFQLDPYHVQKAILKGLGDGSAIKNVRELLREGKTAEALDYIQMYADSVDNDDPSDHRAADARKLYSYLNNNKDGLLPWQKQIGEVPKAPEGILYKNMGVQENQNCSNITLRMKHRRMRWSERGAGNMAKILARRATGELQETIGRYTDGSIPEPKLEEVLKPLSAANAPKKDGKGNPYPERINVHMPLRDALQTASRRAFLRAIEG